MPGSIVLNIRGGDRLHVPSSIDLITPYVLLEQDDWFEDEIRFVRKLLRPGQRALDIGANHGVYTAAMARAVGPEGQVWSFEPAPEAADLMQASFGADTPQVRLLRYQLSGSKSPSAPAESLDRFSAELSWDAIDFAKVDVTAHEPQFLEGGRAFLERQSPLVMYEIEPEVNARPLIGRFAALGYRSFRLVPGLQLLVPLALDEHIDSHQRNLFACKPDRAAQLAREGWLADVSGLPQQRMLADAVALHHAALDAKAAPEERYRSLHDACLAAMSDGQPTLPALMRLARIARDIGSRDLAVRCLTAARPMVLKDWRQVLDQKTLMPSPDLDALRPDELNANRIDCALGEAFFALSCHSTYFTGVQIQPAVESLDVNPYRSAMTERRRQLLRIRAGMQEGPLRHPLLETSSEHNLNPDYWNSGS